MNSTPSDPVARYIRRALPGRLTEEDHRLLSAVGVPTSICIASGDDETDWVLQERDGALHVLDPGVEVACRFRMSEQTFLDLVASRTTPQRAFFTGRLKIEGSRLLALKLGSLLEAVFRRSPWSPELEVHAAAPRPVRTSDTPLTDHQRRTIALHFDAVGGSPFWIERSSRLGVVAADLRTRGDLLGLPAMDREEMARTPFRDFLPQVLQRRSPRLILGETGGATGAPLLIAWTRGDFDEAFVRPLADRLAREGIALRQWLFAGPTGPHIIGKAADALAVETTGIDALRIDLDPRWHRRLVTGSPAAARHMAHFVEQAELHLRREQPDALFITPSLLAALLDAAPVEATRQLRLVHLGGQSCSPEDRRAIAARLPESCMVIDGYGNSLFGCLVEQPGPVVGTFASDAERLIVSPVVDEDGHLRPATPGEWGRIVVHRFDASLLLLNLQERDEALALEHGFAQPRPPADANVARGVY